MNSEEFWKNQKECLRILKEFCEFSETPHNLSLLKCQNILKQTYQDPQEPIRIFKNFLLVFIAIYNI